MKQKLLVLAGAFIMILLVVVSIQQYQLYQTKQYSPEATIQFVSEDVRIDVSYSRPYKNGRVIFGDLVPYGRWWRTGANEPTTITLNRDIIFNESDLLQAGTYSIVTIPYEDYWRLIFSSSVPDWGTNYDASENKLETTMQVKELPQTIEQFIIDFTENDKSAELVMAWDKTKASIPFKVL